MSTHTLEVIVVVVHSNPEVHTITGEGTIQLREDAIETAAHNVAKIIRERVPATHVCSLGFLIAKNNQAEAT